MTMGDRCMVLDAWYK